MFAYDRLNYAKYPPVYCNEMQNLPMEHPEVYEHLKNGGMSVQLGWQTHLDVYMLIKQLRKRQTKTH